jgi:hypothetical protein
VVATRVVQCPAVVEAHVTYAISPTTVSCWMRRSCVEHAAHWLLAWIVLHQHGRGLVDVRLQRPTYRISVCGIIVLNDAQLMRPLNHTITHSKSCSEHAHWLPAAQRWVQWSCN